MGRSVGQLAFGVLGGVIGGLLGPAGFAFSAKGFSIGMMVGGAVLAPKPQQPKLQKLRLSKTEPGAMLPLIYGGVLSGENKGGVRSAGVYIDCSPSGGIKSKMKSASGGGTRGMPEAPKEQKNYLTCALAIADARVAPVVIHEIYFDDKCKFKRGAAGKKAGWADGLVEEHAPDGSIVSEIGKSVELYRGTWHQQPSPTLQQVHAGKPLSAYRGVAYIVFKGVSIQNIPGITVVFSNGVTQCRQIVRFHAKLAQLPDEAMQISSIGGQVRGAFQNSEGGAAELINTVAEYSGCALAEWDGRIQDFSLSVTPTEFVQVPRADLAMRLDDDGKGARTLFKETLDSELPPSHYSLKYSDIERNWDLGEVSAHRHTAGYYKNASSEIGIVGKAAEMRPLVQRQLDQAWMERETREVALPWKYLRVAPGQVLRVLGEGIEDGASDAVFMVKSQGLGRVLTMQGTAYDPTVFGERALSTQPGGELPDSEVAEYATPTLFLADPPALSETERALTGGRLIAAASAPGAWAGAEIIWNSATVLPTTGPLYTPLDDSTSLPQRAVMGVTLDPLPALGDGLRPDFDESVSLRVELIHGALGSASEDYVLRGANQALLKDADGSGRVSTHKNGARALQFKEATQLSTTPNVWILRGLTAGRFNTDYIVSTPAGAQFLLLSDELGQPAPGLARVGVPRGSLNQPLSYVVASADEDGGRSATQTVVCEGNSLAEYAPGLRDSSRAADGALTVTLSTRTRRESDDYWKSGTPPTAGAPLAFDVEIVSAANALLSTQAVTGETLTLDAATITALYGDAHAPVHLFVRQQPSGFWKRYQL